ncbi:Hypothetical predicted protein [Olea europaea subsp. europaea]|uniref:Uncharacterized protein n=1 Tax=Olea europaea subsp. europaea TaxID=158383 RepID=A0A8S0SP93_OLEEU|nr:Hypothetical predicted protein [Olea europaea subsp. europaea]
MIVIQGVERSIDLSHTQVNVFKVVSSSASSTKNEIEKMEKSETYSHDVTAAMGVAILKNDSISSLETTCNSDNFLLHVGTRDGFFEAGG